MVSENINTLLRQLPSVHELADHALLQDACADVAQRTQAARSVLKILRARCMNGELHSAEMIIERIASMALAHIQEPPRPFKRVFNATGVVLHTNLGRAPIADAIWQAMAEARAYCDIEFDLKTGKRASRLRYINTALRELTGAEAGAVFNNNAAGLLITLAALAHGKPIAISRGHIVEIGGGFRLPDIMQASGSPLMELGTANRTHLSDYEEAIEGGAGLVLVVHRSNFSIQGYTSEPSFKALIDLCRARAVPIVFDLGSGALVNPTNFGLPTERTVQSASTLGFDAICFSGDKLMGGPQAGYVVGTAKALEGVRTHPLARAMRCDKLQLAGCLATLELYQRHAEVQLPIFSQQKTNVKARAHQWQRSIDRGEVIECAGAIGGGSLPEARLKGFALALTLGRPEALLGFLRAQDPAIIGHIDKGRVLLHPRTVPEADDEDFLCGLRAALKAAVNA